jgi:6-phosphogluconate dehydrogenase
MTIGFIGLGKMGGNMTKRLIAGGHTVFAYDPSESATLEAQASGATTATSRDDLVSKLETTLLWLMIPAQFVDAEIDALLSLVQPGSVIVDGGNSDFRLSAKRYERCKAKGVSFLDVGTSGGILGLTRGYAMMVGGDGETVNKLSSVFDTLAPPNGWHHFGKPGSGHYVKMVHNAIEYGLMESYAEGYRMLHDGAYEGLDLSAAGRVWANGSIITSLLNDLTLEALAENPSLDGVEGIVPESGETRWTLEVAKQLNIKLPAIEQSMQVRLDSQQGKTNFSTKLLAIMRHKFGGHEVLKDKE